MRLPIALIILAASAGWVQAHPFTCTVQPDGKSVRAALANPFPTETSCTIDCQFSTSKPGTTFMLSCTRSVEAGGAEVELCTKTFDEGRVVKMVSGHGDCVTPLPADKADADDDDEDVDVQKLADPAQLRARVRKNLPPDAQRMLDRMNKP
jgi:hypothetical protein